MFRAMDTVSASPLPPAPDDGLGGAARASLRKLVPIRWVAVAGQLAALPVVYFGLGFELPIGRALGIVAASALFNLIHMARRQSATRFGDFDAALYLGYDIVQLGSLLFFTGGLENP